MSKTEQSPARELADFLLLVAEQDANKAETLCDDAQELIDRTYGHFQWRQDTFSYLANKQDLLSADQETRLGEVKSKSNEQQLLDTLTHGIISFSLQGTNVKELVDTSSSLSTIGAHFHWRRALISYIANKHDLLSASQQTEYCRIQDPERDEWQQFESVAKRLTMLTSMDHVKRVIATSKTLKTLSEEVSAREESILGRYGYFLHILTGRTCQASGSFDQVSFNTTFLAGKQGFRDLKKIASELEEQANGLTLETLKNLLPTLHKQDEAFDDDFRVKGVPRLSTLTDVQKSAKELWEVAEEVLGGAVARETYDRLKQAAGLSYLADEDDQEAEETIYLETEMECNT